MTDAQGTSRNDCLDLVKGIACILIVFMHCEFPGKLGIVIQSISRFCVPFFFMVSGYFFYRENKKTNYWKKIKHVVIITICASVFYLLITPLYSNQRLSFSVKNIVYWIVFNKPYYIAGQLWFLFALLYDYCLFAIIQKIKIQKIIDYGIPAAIVLYIIFAQGLHLLGKSVPNMIYRNFLIEGFAFFALGIWIHEHQDKIGTSNRLLLIGFTCSTILCPVERMILGRDFGVNILSFVQVICLFAFCIKNPACGKNSLLCKLGSDLSMYVYILHPAIWHLLDRLYETIGILDNIVVRYCRPVLCAILAIFISNLVVFTIKQVRLKRERT